MCQHYSVGINLFYLVFNGQNLQSSVIKQFSKSKTSARTRTIVILADKMSQFSNLVEVCDSKTLICSKRSFKASVLEENIKPSFSQPLWIPA